MQKLIGAEWRKLLGHTKAVSFLVWIYPIGALTIVLLIGILPGLLIPSVRELSGESARLWTEDLLTVWNAMNGYPGGTFLRMPFIAFIAVAFAGEYQWGTWKNILPGQSRASLIFAKFLVLGSLIVLALMLTSLIITGGGWLAAQLFEAPYGPAWADVDVVSFFQEFLAQVLVTFAGTFIVAAYAALIAMYSRSVMASLLLSVGLSILEFTSILLLLIAGSALKRPALVNLFVVTPTYNLENVRSWVVDGVGSTAGGIPGFTAVPTLGVSMMILLLWLVGLLAGTAVIFQRQDITT